MKFLIIALVVNTIFQITFAVLYFRVTSKTHIKARELCPKELQNIIPKKASFVDFIVGLLLGFIPVANIIFSFMFYLNGDEIINSMAYKLSLEYVNLAKKHTEELKKTIDDLIKEIHERKK